MTPEEEQQAKQQAAALNISASPVKPAVMPKATSAGTFVPTTATQPANTASGVSGALTPAQRAALSASAQVQGDANRNATEATYAARNAGTSVGVQNNDSNADARNRAIEASRQAAMTAQGGTQAAQVNNTTQSTANFQLNDRQTAARQSADNSVEAARAFRQQVVDQAHGGIPNLVELAEADQRIAAATRSQDVADINAQSENGGVDRIDQQGNAGGIAGFFGGTKAQSNFTARTVQNANAAANRGNVDALTASVGAQNFDAEAARSEAAASQAATIDQNPQNQLRARQIGLADALTASANGQGPSAAQAQLQAGTDASIASALSLAHSGRGGNSFVALKNALMQNGTTMQQAANSAAQLRAKEQQDARSQLAGVLDSSRGADIGVATSQAGLSQQTALANSAQAQQTALANAANEQQANLANQQAAFDKNKAIAALLAQGASMDQAQQQAQIQQAQFNAELQAKQEAARNGQNYAAGSQQLQAAGTGIAALGSIAATAVSDKREKNNISDGEEETRAFLKSLSKPRGFEYKNQAFGTGHHLGVMAQDVEKGLPGIVIDDTDGVKKIDIRKALSASLASLGNIDKRLSKMETKRG